MGRIVGMGTAVGTPFVHLLISCCSFLLLLACSTRRAGMVGRPSTDGAAFSSSRQSHPCYHSIFHYSGDKIAACAESADSPMRRTVRKRKAMCVRWLRLCNIAGQMLTAVW